MIKSRETARQILVLIPIFLTSTFLIAQESQIKAVRAGRLFDSTAGRLLADQVVLIEGEKIVQVGPSTEVKIPTGAAIIDLSKATVLPGLVDAHTHIFNAGHAGLKPGGPPDVDSVK